MNVCLPNFIAEDLKKKIVSGEINPAELSAMTSEERNAFFEKLLGKGLGSPVNALFEKKLILKNQQKGFIDWAKQLTNIKPSVKKDLLERISNMDQRILSPEESDKFLTDLAEQRLGFGVTQKEAGNITILAKEAQDAKAAINPNSGLMSADRMKYGRALFDFQEYVKDLKVKSKELSFEDFKNSPGQAIGRTISNIGGLAKSLKASLDDSVVGRQGLKVFFVDNKTWRSNSIKSLSDIVRTFGGENVRREVLADVLSRPNAINGLYDKEKLAIGNTEEAFPTSLPERIPVAGRVFKAAETAFTAFQYRTRADVFDRLVKLAEDTGQNYEGLGKLVNSLTGRGHLGVFEPIANATNNIFFSPRFFKSNIDLLTLHAFDKNISPFVRKQAAQNILKVIGGIATILAFADALSPSSVEKDTISSDSGKIKIGGTRFDVSGGISSISTLASRLAFGKLKSSTTGKVTSLTSGKFGEPNRIDALVGFFENKLSPLAGVLVDIAKNQDHNFKKPTIAGEANQLLTPLPITNYQELTSKEGAPLLAGLIADFLGISTNTY